MQTKIKKLITATIALFLLLSLFAPALTFAMGSGTEATSNGATLFFQDDSHDEEDSHEEDDTHSEEGDHSEESSAVSEGNAESAGAAITLTLIAGVLIIIFVVAIIGAVGLGIIGIGYAFINGGGEE